MTSFADDAFPKERLEVLLDPDTAYATADVRVIDGLGGDVVAGRQRGSVVFYLPPKALLRRSQSWAGPGRGPRRAVRASGRAADDRAAAD